MVPATLTAAERPTSAEPGRRAAAPAAAAVCAAPLLVATVLVFRDGGFRIADAAAAAVALCVLCAVAAAALDGPWGDRTCLVAVAGLGGLALWQSVSAAWADAPGAAVQAGMLTALYAAALAAVVIGLREARWLRWIADGALAYAGVVAFTGVGSRLLPDLIGGDVDARLSNPLGYWNALGALMAMGAVLGAGVAGRPDRHAAWRAAAAALAPVFLLGLLLTLSRGAVVALAIGVGVLVALARPRLEAVVAALVVAAASTPLLVYANAQDGLSGLGGALPEHADAGARVAAVLVVTMAGSALAAWLAAWLLRGAGGAARRHAGRALAGLALVAAAALLVAVARDAGSVERQWDAFRTYAPGTRPRDGSIVDRLAVAGGSGRWQQWEIAAGQFADAPIAGTGAGDFAAQWDRHRTIDQEVRNAHSLYLETLAESGLLGAALILASLGAGGLAVVRLRRAGDEGTAGVAAVAAAGVAVVVAHAAGDWDWQIPAATLPAVVLGGALLKAAALAGGTARRPGTAGTVAGVAVALVAAAAFLGPAAAAARVDGAREDAAAGRLGAALDDARDAAALDPRNADARLLEAQVLTDLGRPAEADGAYADAIRRAPRRWDVPADWAAALIRRGDDVSARALLRRAAALNPREPRIALLQRAAAP